MSSCANNESESNHKQTSKSNSNDECNNSKKKKAAAAVNANATCTENLTTNNDDILNAVHTATDEIANVSDMLPNAANISAKVAEGEMADCPQNRAAAVTDETKKLFTISSSTTVNTIDDSDSTTEEAFDLCEDVRTRSAESVTMKQPMKFVAGSIAIESNLISPYHATDESLPHIASEPSFGLALRRNQQQQQEIFRSCRDAKYNEAICTSSADDIATSSCGFSNADSVCVSVSSSSMMRKSSDTDTSLSMPRRVSFPKSDNELVTGYLEPANPWEYVYMVQSISEIAELYVISCQKHNTKPLQSILDHLKSVELSNKTRQPLLSLKSIKMEASDCEALEEIFKRVQYKTVDLSSCELSEAAAMALFEMIEYYEAANELDISWNPNGMTHRGWTSCTYMVSHSRALQVFNAQGNPISRSGAENLGHALSTSNIHTIKLEHCGLKGPPLNGLCFKLRHNRVLREMWLGHNDLDCDDAESIAVLLSVNHYLQLVDISNNNIRDEGLKKIVAALITQSREIEKRSMLQRTTAIDDDDCNVIEKTSGGMHAMHYGDMNSINDGDSGLIDSDASQSEDTDDDAFDSKQTLNNTNKKTPAATSTEEETFPGNEAAAAVTAAADDLDADEEDTENTVKSTPTATLKNSTQTSTVGGQSMLDKLLSMNSTESSSSDDGASNLSTDTLAPCCSEDISPVSDDIFDRDIATAIANTTATANGLTKAVQASAVNESTNNTAATTAATTTATCTEEPKKREPDPVAANKENNIGTTNNAVNKSSTISSNCNSNGVSNSHNHHQQEAHQRDRSLHTTSCVFEVTPEETHCLISTSLSKALDVNKALNKLVDDFDDTHSTDSAFESASEGDISRHLPEEFSRLSASLDSSRIDEVAASKEFAGVETATIATESTECLVTAAAAGASNSLKHRETALKQMPAQLSSSSSPAANKPSPAKSEVFVGSVIPPVVISVEERSDNSISGDESSSLPLSSAPAKVTISESSLFHNKSKLFDVPSPRPTPPPPVSSPGGASLCLRRTETSCDFITSATRNRSQSSDSLCSDTSLDGSLSSDINYSTSTQFNENLAKNDTLTRQQRHFEAPAEANSRAPCGLKALALWNNNLTKQSGYYISELLTETASLELLNIGKNCLSNEFVSTIKDGLMRNTTLTTLGLQSTHLSAKGIDTLSSILTFGGNCTLQRIDIRDNKLEVESLATIEEALKSNTTVTQIDIDDEPKRLSVGNDAHLDYARVLQNVRSMCSRNEKTQSQLQAADKSPAMNNVAGRSRGYYLGSRKISLTCQTRAAIADDSVDKSAVTASVATNSKLDVKRKTGTRLRSPIPSPPTVSPSSSPSRSRFKVFRVNEVSPLSSPLSSTPPTTTTASCSVVIPTTTTTTTATTAASFPPPKVQSTSLPNANSMSFMANVTSSTQSIKRYSVSPRSRFQVSKIYEDPRVPLANRALPPLNAPLAQPMKSSGITTSSSPSVLIQTADPMAALPTTAPSSATTAIDVAPKLSHTPNVESTKSTICESSASASASAAYSNISSSSTPQSQTTLSPVLYASSTSTSSSSSPSSCSSSSSSSTSPASMSSSSSSIISAASSASSSASPSLIPLFSSSSSSINSDNADSAPALLADVVAAGARLPTAVFDENEATLTNSSANNVSAAVADDNAQSHLAEDTRVVQQQPQQPQQARVRKTSWLGNPAAVDKLLTLFHNPGTIFQRSSSPDKNSTPLPTAATAPLEENLPTVHQKSLVLTRKSSPPSWSKLGNEMMRPVTSALQQTNCGEATNGAVSLSATAEQSISFLDAASKQICDFSKQVFRQNLTFGNETNSAIAPIGIGAGSSVGSALGGNIISEVMPEQQHDAVHIPSKVQLQIKENISPEHTITEEALQSLQKLCAEAAVGGSGAGSVSSSIFAASNDAAFDESASNERSIDESKELQLLTVKRSNSSSSSSSQTANASTTTNNSLQNDDPYSITPQIT